MQDIEMAGLWEYEDFIISEEMEEDREYWESKPAPLTWEPPMRLRRRAELFKRKAAVKKRKSRIAWTRDEDGTQVWYLDVPGPDAIGIEANTPDRCGRWCVCKDRGKNYNRAAFKRSTAREIKWEN